jgi:molybdopterin-guanine dinucleotide biosynthesis protein A
MSIFASAALLTGGKSARMGFDKKIFYAKSGLLSHILPALAMRFEDIMMVGCNLEVTNGNNLRVIEDIIPGHGPLSGIHAAVSCAKGDYVYVIACDMPEISLDYIDYMTDRLTRSPADACVTVKDGWAEPFHGFYGISALPAIENALLSGGYSVNRLLERMNTLYIPEAEARRFTPAWSLFSNLNTREDYIRASGADSQADRICADTVKQVSILRIENGMAYEKAEPAVTEQPLDIYVNGKLRASLTATPEHLEELAAGYLFSAGITGGFKDIKRLDSGAYAVYAEAVCDEAAMLAACDGFNITINEVLNNMKKFMQMSELFYQTGAVHSCALIVDGQLVHFMEDIGRYNAFDKTIGAALNTATPLYRAVVLTSGRVPSDMMAKIIYSGIPVAVSRGAPTADAIELARRYNVTLCGFARGNRINIYTCRQRMKGAGGEND